MTAIAKTNELHAYLIQVLAGESQQSDGYTQTVVCLVLEQAVLALIGEMQDDAVADPKTLEQQINWIKNDASNWLVARICREYYQPGHWLNDLRIARKQLLQSVPTMTQPENRSMIISSTAAETANSLNHCVEGLELLMAEVREYNVEY